MRNRCYPIDAALLMVLLALSACVDEVEQTVYDYSPVKTEFAMFVPEVDSKEGRMTTQVVAPQAASFGMRKMCLYPFEVGGEAGHRKLTSEMLLQGSNVLNSSNNEVGSRHRGSSSSVWFENISVPQRTNYFLMYGVQPNLLAAVDQYGLDVTLEARQGEGFQNGLTKTNLYGEEIHSQSKLSTFRFAPAPIFERGFFNVNERALTQASLQDRYWVRRHWVLTYLRGITSAAAGDGNEWYRTENSKLQLLYRAWIGFSEGGRMINASSKSILALAEHLHRQVCGIEQELAVENTKDRALAEAIKKAIVCTIEVKGHGGLTVGVTTAQEQAVGEQAYPLKYVAGTDPQFPLSIGLPDGALQVSLSPGQQRPGAVDFVHELSGDPIENTFAYPAQQYFTSRSEIGVSSKNHKKDFSSGMGWSDFVNNNYKEDYVYPYSRSLVLKSPVKFGMANLSTKIQFEPGAKILDSRGQEVTVVGTNLADFKKMDAAEQVKLLSENITLTGVLVSDQREVGWDFTRESADAEPAAYLIYDRMLNAQTEGRYQSKTLVTRDHFKDIVPNHTLIYPSKVLKTNVNDRIFIVLEFENGNAPFYGVDDQLIPAHSRFYLTYLMDARKLGIAEGQQIFSSAQMVDLQLTITALSGAHNVLPDVRMIKVNLGVAAKISWESGFVFNDVPVHGN